jgi:hypothetical protein
MENGGTVVLIGLGGFLIGRAIWQSIAHRRHLAWIAALAGPVGLVGIVIDQTWPLLVGLGLLVLGEFLYQTGDEVSPARYRELRDDVQIGGRRRYRRKRPRGGPSES